MNEDLSRSTARVAIFIDGLNTMFRLRESGWEESYDLGYLTERLARNRDLRNVFFFTARPQSPPATRPQYWKEMRHLSNVEKRLWNDYARKVRYGYFVPRSWGWLEKQTDVWLVSEMITQAWFDSYDVAVLVTADTDMVPAVWHTRMLKKGVELLVFPNSPTKITQLVRAVHSTTTARKSWFRPY